MMKRLGLMISGSVLLFLFATSTAAEDINGKQYYLRHPLIFIGDRLPEISPDHILFTERCIEGVEAEVYDGKILRRETPVRIDRIDRDTRPAKVHFIADNKKFTVVLKGVANKDFNRAFDLVFAPKATKESYKGSKNKDEVIRRYGFPISICKAGDEEKWFYIVEFAATGWGGYDGWWVKIKNGKVVGVSGYI
jgi:hypothetical protein